MRAALRDAKIAAAVASGRVKPVTTLAQRRAARRAEKYRGWRYVTVEPGEVPVGPLPEHRPLPRDSRGRAPRFSDEHMADSKRKHGGALRGGRPKHQPATPALREAA